MSALEANRRLRTHGALQVAFSLAHLPSTSAPPLLARCYEALSTPPQRAACPS